MKRPAEWYQQYRANRAGALPHGTQNGYANWGCRCPLCTDAHREHVDNYRARHNAPPLEIPAKCTHLLHLGDPHCPVCDKHPRIT